MGGRLPSLSTREVLVALKKLGFDPIPGRGKGSHSFLWRADPPCGVTLPQAGDVKRGTLRSILRQADLSIDEFLDALK
jgi:predicted RNA binding protein YcfA (HicA-like mRNA interferase family)